MLMGWTALPRREVKYPESECQELWMNGLKWEGKTPETAVRGGGEVHAPETFSPNVGGSFTDIKVLNVSSVLRLTELWADKA